MYESDPSTQDTVEGLALVVETEGEKVWLEPEQTSSCGTCASASACGIKSGHPRLTARRFALANEWGLKVGERVVVGISDRALLKASMTTYGIPLLTTLAAGITAQKGFGAGDVASALAAVTGLVVGFFLVRFQERRFVERGELLPYFIRRAPPVEVSGDCHGTV
jgi:sigma-E factor negative regulatory protein RseC